MRVIQDLYNMVTIEIFTQVWTIRVAGADSWGTTVMWLRQRKVGCLCILENWLTTMRAYPQPKGRDISSYRSWIRKPRMSLRTSQMNGFLPIYAKTSQQICIPIKAWQNALPKIWCFGCKLHGNLWLLAWSNPLFYPVHFTCYVSNECRILCNWHWRRQILNNTPEAFKPGCEYRSYQ